MCSGSVLIPNSQPPALVTVELMTGHCDPIGAVKRPCERCASITALLILQTIVHTAAALTSWHIDSGEINVHEHKATVTEQNRIEHLENTYFKFTFIYIYTIMFFFPPKLSLPLNA